MVVKEGGEGREGGGRHIYFEGDHAVGVWFVAGGPLKSCFCAPISHPPSSLPPSSSEVINKFLESVEHNTILFYLNAREDLIPAIIFPPSLKKKSVYFLKANVGTQLSDKLDHELISGDLSSNPLEFLSVLLDEVYLPLLTNPKNLENWPEVVANDVLRHFHNLNGAVYVISGKSKVRRGWGDEEKGLIWFSCPTRSKKYSVHVLLRERLCFLCLTVRGSIPKAIKASFIPSSLPSLTGLIKSKKSSRAALPDRWRRVLILAQWLK